MAASTPARAGLMLGRAAGRRPGPPAAGQPPAAGATTRYLAGTLLVDGAVAEATDAGTGRALVTIDNRGPGPDRLLAVAVPSVGAAALVSADGAALAVLDLPAGAVAAMKADGIRVALTGLALPLRAGDRLPGTLMFERAGPLRVEFAVTGAPAGAPAP